VGRCRIPGSSRKWEWLLQHRPTGNLIAAFSRGLGFIVCGLCRSRSFVAVKARSSSFVEMSKSRGTRCSISLHLQWTVAGRQPFLQGRGSCHLRSSVVPSLELIFHRQWGPFTELNINQMSPTPSQHGCSMLSVVTMKYPSCGPSSHGYLQLAAKNRSLTSETAISPLLDWCLCSRNWTYGSCWMRTIPNPSLTNSVMHHSLSSHR
jgi:hypothetical protein